MKFRVDIEDFIADEEDKELAKVAFTRARNKIDRRFKFVLIPIAILVLFGILFNALALLVVLLSVIIIVLVVWLVKQQEIYRKEYERQLDELKLQMRGKE